MDRQERPFSLARSILPGDRRTIVTLTTEPIIESLQEDKGGGEQ